ncbi:MAG: glycosyltransferase [Bacteroidota bacterium]|nr:glycosyltransferase [Bacteroidota bacterium]
MKEIPKVLIFTYYWPPSGGSGVQRWVYFAKYMNHYGFKPIVVTVDPKSASFHSFDFSLEKEIENLQVYKTRSREILKTYRFLFKNKSKQPFPQGDISNKGFLSKVVAFIRGNFFIPDARKGWNSFAIRVGEKILSKEKIHSVITTGPPHSTHLIGLKLKEKFKFNWLVDLRDPWTDIFYLKSMYRTSWANRKDLKYETKVLNSADAILTTAKKNFHEQLRKNIIDKNKPFYNIYNGYDHESFSKIKSENNKIFTLGHIGLITRNQSYKKLIIALKSIKEIHPEIKIKFCFAGSTSQEIIDEFSKVVSVENHGYVIHDKAVGLMKSSHVLINFLFNQSNYTTMISGKLIEYMATGNPILVIGDLNTEVSDLMKISHNSSVCLSNDTKSMKNYILRIYNLWIEDRLEPKIPSGIQNYTRKFTTKQLCKIINAMH